MKGCLVYVEYPMLVAMGAKKEWTSELHELPHLVTYLLGCTCCLICLLAINGLKLVHEVHDHYEMSFYPLGAKGHLEHQQHLQEDDCVPDVDPLLALRKDPHEQLILIGWSCPLGPAKLASLFELGLDCRWGRSFVHFTRREWYTPSSASAPRRERLFTRWR